MVRQNFYMGQSVTPENLNELQNYSDANRSKIVNELLGYGVVNGFEVSHIEGFIVGVTSGLGFNTSGERLSLESGKQVNLIEEAPSVGERDIKLGIELDYIKEDPILDSLGNTQYKKWTPTVKFVYGQTLESQVLELVTIKLNPVSVVEITNTNKEFINLQKQLKQTKSFSTEIVEDVVTANINSDILKINSKTFEETIRDMVYPIGCTYVQYPEDNGQFLSNSEPSILFGGRWTMIHNHGVFFRTAWGVSSVINEDRDTSDFNIQNDAVVRMTGRFSADDLSATGVFRYDGISDYFANGNNGMSYIVFDNSLQVKTSSENRPRNMLIQIWRRTN